MKGSCVIRGHHCSLALAVGWGGGDSAPLPKSEHKELEGSHTSAPGLVPPFPLPRGKHDVLP